ncbi:MAG: BatA domain-containing protein [Gemmatimonadaceae bacterium]|nr:BatA domain-containing protein [Gemmatimonadaceae bacterium]
MGFLAPAFLFLAALAGVPLLVHLLRRRVSRTVDFPAVRYLARMEQEHSRERKLRHRLLLFLRMLAVLALAAAAARPIARWAGLGHAPVAVAVVIDNSMSSGAVHDGRVVLDDLRNDARSLLRALTPDDRAWLITADGRVIGGAVSALEDALTAMHPLGGRGDLVAATRRAMTLVRSGAPRAPVVTILSDGQATAWSMSSSDTAASRVLEVGDVPVQLLTRPRSVVRNAAVVDVRADPARWTPAGAVAFAVVSPDSAAWRISLDGRTVARGTAPPATADAPQHLAQKLASTSIGWVRGSIELDADELRGDDARWFAVRVAPPPAVMARAEGGPFLSAALSTLVEEKRLERATAGGRGVVTVSGADAPVASGPALLTAPSDPVRVGEANRTLARLGIPWRFGAIARDVVLMRGAPALEGVSVRIRYPLQRSPGTSSAGGGTDTLATAGGTPWAVAGDGYVLLASPIDPEATDLPLRAGFVPWLLDALSRRLGDDGQIIEATPGQHLVDRTFSTASGLERPDRTVVPMSGDRLTVPNETGVYFLRRQALRIGAIVVNAEAMESDLRAEPVTDIGQAFRRRVSGRFAGVDTVVGSWRTRALNQAAGRSLLTPLVGIALLALLLEAWFSRGASASTTNPRDPDIAVARAA